MCFCQENARFSWQYLNKRIVLLISHSDSSVVLIRFPEGLIEILQVVNIHAVIQPDCHEE
jgi:hypothetical protein